MSARYWLDLVERQAHQVVEERARSAKEALDKYLAVKPRDAEAARKAIHALKPGEQFFGKDGVVVRLTDVPQLAREDRGELLSAGWVVKCGEGKCEMDETAVDAKRLKARLRDLGWRRTAAKGWLCPRHSQEAGE